MFFATATSAMFFIFVFVFITSTMTFFAFAVAITITFAVFAVTVTITVTATIASARSFFFDAVTLSDFCTNTFVFNFVNLVLLHVENECCSEEDDGEYAHANHNPN